MTNSAGPEPRVVSAVEALITSGSGTAAAEAEKVPVMDPDPPDKVEPIIVASSLGKGASRWEKI
jgi:hypothetical protein